MSRATGNHAIVQARRLSLFGYISRMPDETDARELETTRTSSYYMDEDYPARPEV